MDLSVQIKPLEVLLIGGSDSDLQRVRADLHLPHFNVQAASLGGDLNDHPAPGDVDVLVVRIRNGSPPAPPVAVAEFPVVALTDASGDDSRMLALEAGAVEQVGMEELGSTVLIRVVRFALERHRLESELRRMAHADPLTGLRNRRYLGKHMATAVSSSKRHGHRLSIAVGDIDNFKIINDTYGHTVGDEVLRAIAVVLREGIRSEDVAARFGGDEFCLVLSHVGRDEAEKAVERIRRSVENISVLVGDRPIQVSATFAIAELADGIDDAQALFDAADQALIEAKRTGRNRSVIAR